jgi:hypothetical protein
MKNLNIKDIDTSILNEFQSRDLTNLIKVNEEFSKFYPSSVFLAVSDDAPLNCYEYTYISATYKNLNFSVRYSEHKKKYTIYCEDLRKFQNVTTYTRREIEKNTKEPQNIGVLNLKKIISWFDYYVEIYKELEKADQNNADLKNAFLDSIKDLPVVWNYDKKGGEIVKNGVVFEFKIEETYVRQIVKLDYKVPNTLEAFFKLAENKY